MKFLETTIHVYIGWTVYKNSIEFLIRAYSTTACFNRRLQKYLLYGSKTSLKFLVIKMILEQKTNSRSKNCNPTDCFFGDFAHWETRIFFRKGEGINSYHLITFLFPVFCSANRCSLRIRSAWIWYKVLLEGSPTLYIPFG